MVFSVRPESAPATATLPVPAPGAGTGNVAVAGALSGLTENTTYHFRIVTKNARGTPEREREDARRVSAISDELREVAESD